MWIRASRNGRWILICLKIKRSHSSSSSFFCYFTLDGKGRFDDFEGWLRSFAFLDCEEDLGEFFMDFLTVLVKHLSYRLRVVLETNPCAFDGFVSPLSESEDQIS
nr:hypothetical protein [Tanacetum cinerariifolium]